MSEYNYCWKNDYYFNDRLNYCTLPLEEIRREVGRFIKNNGLNTKEPLKDYADRYPDVPLLFLMAVMDKVKYNIRQIERGELPKYGVEVLTKVEQLNEMTKARKTNKTDLEAKATLVKVRLGLKQVLKALNKLKGK